MTPSDIFGDLQPEKSRQKYAIKQQVEEEKSLSLVD